GKTVVTPVRGSVTARHDTTRRYIVEVLWRCWYVTQVFTEPLTRFLIYIEDTHLNQSEYYVWWGSSTLTVVTTVFETTSPLRATATIHRRQKPLRKVPRRRSVVA
ncbi:hypothetical protein J6590_104726, partial [Homalodisca vitripennis]